MLDIVALGDCDVDVYVKVKRLPAYDEKVPGDYIGVYGGGVAANFACAAARMGMRTGIISTVGDDHFGEIAVRSLQEYQVDTGGVTVVAGVPTYFSIIALDHTGEKALIIVRTDVFFPEWKYVQPAYIENARLLHIAPFNLQVAAQAAEHARRAGVPVSVDLEYGMVGGGLEPVIPLLKRTQLLFPNEQCMNALFGAVPVEEGAARLLSYGPEAVIVTLGARGAFILTRSESIRVDAYRVDTKDTTGAGDCFNAAFVSLWLRGEPLAVCGRFAAAAAALSVTAVGARGYLPTPEEVGMFLSERASTTSPPAQ